MAHCERDHDRRPVTRRLGLLLLALLLSSCGVSNAPPAAPRLVFRHSRMVAAADPLPALLRDFERRYGVAVASEPLPWTADVQHQFYVINLEGRSQGFDVLMLDVIWVPEFARAGWLLDLTERWPARERAQHVAATVEAATLDGRTWAVPWVMNVGLLYYRRDLLARHRLRAPRTYDELVDDARRVMATERDAALAGFVWQGKQYEGLVVNVLESMWAVGTDLVGGDGGIFPDRQRAVRALAARRAMLASGVSPALVTGADEELTRREFGAGRAVFLRNWPYAQRLFESPGSPVRGKVGITALPGGGALGGAHLGIHRATRQPEMAWRLVEFLTAPEAQRAIAAATGLHPTRPALLEPSLAAIFAGARARPVTPWYQTLSATLQPELSAAIVGVKTPERAIDDAGRRLRFFLAGAP